MISVVPPGLGRSTCNFPGAEAPGYYQMSLRDCYEWGFSHGNIAPGEMLLLALVRELSMRETRPIVDQGTKKDARRRPFFTECFSGGRRAMSAPAQHRLHDLILAGLAYV